MSTFKKILFLFLSVALLANAEFASAQENPESANEELRSEFRAALLSDPRTSSLSEAELSAMIDALAEEAKSQDIVSDFVLPPLPEIIQEYTDELVTPWGQPVTPQLLFGIILACLACAILLLWWLLHLHKCTDRS